MTKAGPKPITPSTQKFRAYIEECVRPHLSEHCSRQQVSVLIDLLTWLEQQRYDYSAARAFQTRPLANAAIADRFGVTVRSVRRWFAQLEELGIIARELRKNAHHSYKNLLNRIRFSSFFDWFKTKEKQTPDRSCPPKKKDIKNISISDEDFDEKKKAAPSFPATGSITYDPYWSALADQHLVSGRSRPDRNKVAENFRANLAKHQIALTDKSITQRWINFCKAALPVT